MDLRFTDEDEAFRSEVAAFFEAELSGPFSAIRHRGGPGDETALIEERKAWEKRLGEAGWIGLAWPCGIIAENSSDYPSTVDRSLIAN